LLEQRLGVYIKPDFTEWRPGDQRVYVSDIRKAQRELGWSPGIGIDRGIDDLISWAKSIL
jgi:CDP-paratose 2-epimerase